MTDVQQSDAMKNLVIFIIALAILGTIIALALYFAVDLLLQTRESGMLPSTSPSQ